MKERKKHSKLITLRINYLIIVLVAISSLILKNVSGQSNSPLPPSCNLIGSLKGQFNPSGGSIIVMKADVANDVAGTTYLWKLEANYSGAVISEGQGTRTVKMKAGVRQGNFVIHLTVTTPRGLSCECSKSITAGVK